MHFYICWGIQRSAEEKAYNDLVFTLKPGADFENVKTELDLRGMMVDDACLEIDKFLDDAVLNGLTQVTIIHGKGTGALRKGVHEYLRGHRHVRSFRLGVYGEGESGVSIVELK